MYAGRFSNPHGRQTVGGGDVASGEVRHSGPHVIGTRRHRSDFGGRRPLILAFINSIQHEGTALGCVQ
jgi:hypothetical protein